MHKVFIHLEATMNTSRRNIISLMIDGALVSDEDIIADYVEVYYKHLYKSVNLVEK